MRRAERKIQDEAKVRDLLAHAAVGHLEKYQPGAGWGAFPAANLALTAVVRINIEAMTGKEHTAKR